MLTEFGTVDCWKATLSALEHESQSPICSSRIDMWFFFNTGDYRRLLKYLSEVPPVKLASDFVILTWRTEYKVRYRHAADNVYFN